MIRKIAVSAAWFFGLCAVLSFVGGVIGYSLSEGGSPGEREAAAVSLVDSWGSAYIAGIMACAALVTIAGLVTRKLPGLDKA